MNEELLKLIKSRGYWRVNFRPNQFRENFYPNLATCKEVMEKASVLLRGWDYPHFPKYQEKNGGLLPENNCYLGWIDWGIHIEFWKMYLSGQFINYRSFWEDWYERRDDLPQLEPNKYLGVTGLVYQVTEIFEFVSKLCRLNYPTSRIKFALALHNLNFRELRVDTPGRIPFIIPPKTLANEITYEEEFSTDELISSSIELSFNCILHLLDRFGWHTPPIETIRKDQNELIKGLL